MEVDSDVISGVIVDPISVKVAVKCGDSRSNRSPDIRLPHFVTSDGDYDDAGGQTLWLRPTKLTQNHVITLGKHQIIYNKRLSD